MKYLTISLLALVGVTLLGLFYYEENCCSLEQGMANMKSENTFLACALTDSELAERKRTVLSEIHSAIKSTKELDNGYSFQFPNDDGVLPKVLEVIALESACCSFLEFDLKVEANEGPIWLQLTGQEGTKEFIKENFITKS